MPADIRSFFGAKGAAASAKPATKKEDDGAKKPRTSKLLPMVVNSWTSLVNNESSDQRGEKLSMIATMMWR